MTIPSLNGPRMLLWILLEDTVARKQPRGPMWRLLPFQFRPRRGPSPKAMGPLGPRGPCGAIGARGALASSPRCPGAAALRVKELSGPGQTSRARTLRTFETLRRLVLEPATGHSGSRPQGPLGAQKVPGGLYGAPWAYGAQGPMRPHGPPWRDLISRKSLYSLVGLKWKAALVPCSAG